MNLIENAKKQIDELLAGAYEKAAAQGLLPEGAVLTGRVDIPKEPRHCTQRRGRSRRYLRKISSWKTAGSTEWK